MNTFGLLIIAYNKVVCNGDVLYCRIETKEGRLGLEARHEPLLCVLKDNSSIQYRDVSGSEKSIKVNNGMLSFKKNKCTIIVSLAEKAKSTA